MGAIAALHHHRDRDAPDPQVVRRMLRAAPHRGGDVDTLTLGRTVLGTVNDPAWVTASMAGTEGLACVFAGALDNSDALQRNLERGGHEISGTSPAALVLAWWRLWGRDGIKHLRGSFAGIVTDGQQVWCYRDHFGWRPLYCRNEPGRFLAATEVKQVLAGTGLPREPDLDHLYRVLYGGIGTSTAFKGVGRVRRSQTLAVDAEGQVSSARYWDPAALVESSSLTWPEAVEGVREHLREATRRCLTGRDVLLLSGGLDSPSLAAMAAGASPGRPVVALTAGYDQYPSVDETQWTRMAADHVGMHLETFQASASSLDDLEHWMGLLDGPVDRLSIPEISEAYRTARERADARCVLNGEIAESLFHADGYLLDHLVGNRRWRGLQGQIAARRERGRSWRWIMREMAHIAVPNPVLYPAMRWRAAHRGLSWLAPWIDHHRLLTAPTLPSFLRMPRSKRWAALQVRPFEGAGESLEAGEHVAAVHGLDIRRPFADVDLWAFVLGLPAEVKIPSLRPKSLLREAMRGALPDELLDRPDKTYFDEFHLATAEYGVLKRYLINPSHRMPGIDYELLAQRLETGAMPVTELQRARDLVRIHAFIDLWS